ncbi:MAG TPA: MmcQ/YjbR family DNA-binding protein [Arachnia sp.]|nr:MmcQ/YjbR family DNA-binding protein [Arachnia sp.]HMT84779.1 MmcQ/YjbR family DNA-binding protein [Arachnia sp.]
MAHELMFDPDDPTLARVRTLALALPGAQERISVGHANFATKRVFAWYGMSHKVDGVWRRNPQSVSVLLPPDERLALIERADVFVPGYIGPSGWLGILLADDTDWTEIEELIEESYRQTAPARLVAQLG